MEIFKMLNLGRKKIFFKETLGKRLGCPKKYDICKINL